MLESRIRWRTPCQELPPAGVELLLICEDGEIKMGRCYHTGGGQIRFTLGELASAPVSPVIYWAHKPDVHSLLTIDVE